MEPDPQRIEVHVSSNLRRFRINQQRSKILVNELGRALKLPPSMVNLSFVGSQTSAKLNATFRRKTQPTDVLSFPQFDWPLPALSKEHSKASPAKIRQQAKFVHDLVRKNPILHLGDIVICVDVAARNAKSLGHGTDREVCFLIIHGLLHLCGHDHMKAKEEDVMNEQQRWLLQLCAAQNHRNKTLWRQLVTTRPQPKLGKVPARES